MYNHPNIAEMQQSARLNAYHEWLSDTSNIFEGINAQGQLGVGNIQTSEVMELFRSAMNRYFEQVGYPASLNFDQSGNLQLSYKDEQGHLPPPYQVTQLLSGIHTSVDFYVQACNRGTDLRWFEWNITQAMQTYLECIIGMPMAPQLPSAPPLEEVEAAVLPSAPPLEKVEVGTLPSPPLLEEAEVKATINANMLMAQVDNALLDTTQKVASSLRGASFIENNVTREAKEKIQQDLNKKLAEIINTHLKEMKIDYIEAKIDDKSQLTLSGRELEGAGQVGNIDSAQYAAIAQDLRDGAQKIREEHPIGDWQKVIEQLNQDSKEYIDGLYSFTPDKDSAYKLKERRINILNKTGKAIVVAASVGALATGIALTIVENNFFISLAPVAALGIILIPVAALILSYNFPSLEETISMMNRYQLAPVSKEEIIPQAQDMPAQDKSGHMEVSEVMENVSQHLNSKTPSKWTEKINAKPTDEQKDLGL